MSSLVPFSSSLFDGGGHGLATGGRFRLNDQEKELFEAQKTAAGETFNQASTIAQFILRRFIQHTKWEKDEAGSWKYQLVGVEEKPLEQPKAGIPVERIFAEKTERIISGLTGDAAETELEVLQAMLATDPVSAYFQAEMLKRRLLEIKL